MVKYLRKKFENLPQGHHLGGPYLENGEKKFQRNFG